MTGIFITARLGSTRLSQKHLIEANGVTFIEYLTKRFEHTFEDEIKSNELQVFIVTSKKPENKKFEEIYHNTTVKVFYGADDNIPLRHLECAEANEITNIISIDGDDILCSTNAAEIVAKELKKGSLICKTEGLPLGMNVMGYTTQFLSGALETHKNSVLETGWGRIFDTAKIKTVTINEERIFNRLRMTLDYSQDAVFFKTVIEQIGEPIVRMSDSELINLVIANKWNELNKDLSDQYWENFNKLIKSE